VAVSREELERVLRAINRCIEAAERVVRQLKTYGYADEMTVEEAKEITLWTLREINRVLALLEDGGEVR